jgi:hypothetical protein
MVYAFLGLAHEGYGVVPDCTDANDIIKVLIETAKGIIRFDKSLDILQHVHRGRENLGFRLPSLDDYLWEEEGPPFDAAKGLPADVEFSSDTSEAYYEDLKVYGIFLDYIED